VKIVLEDGSAYRSRRAALLRLSVDPTSGQITLRAEVPNPSGLLLPGMYVRVRLEQAETPTGIVVPQQAVTRGTAATASWWSAADGKVDAAPVKVGSARGGRSWVILEGLKPDELVMVDGFQKLRGNAPVKPVAVAAARLRAGRGQRSGRRRVQPRRASASAAR
jgi:membrane fusion protein (multidrug efflux system)